MTDSACKCKCYEPGCLSVLTMAVARLLLIFLVLFPFFVGACQSDPEGTGPSHDWRCGRRTIGALWYVLGRGVSKWSKECYESDRALWVESSDG